MSTGAGPQGTRDMLVKFCGMLGSEFDGERAVAALKATGLLLQAGLRWEDVLVVPAASDHDHPAASRRQGAPLSDLRADLACCQRHQSLLTGEEAHYVEELRRLVAGGRTGFRTSDRTRLSAIARRIRRVLSRHAAPGSAHACWA